jgi:LAO/AO transport system kinase
MRVPPPQQLEKIRKGDIRSLARAISYIENDREDYSPLLAALPPSPVNIIGVTGPPGAGKSTLVDALIGHAVTAGRRIAVLCVDPSSSLYFGALLGDRIRMSEWYTHPAVYIRSLSTRGTLGGLNPRIIGITDLLKAAPFDSIIVETVGVGQNEIEIAGLADRTIVVLAPEAGDDIQSKKAGLMEIADIFVVNKSDRPDADLFVRHLKSMQSLSARRESRDVPIIKTIASQRQGIGELAHAIRESLERQDHPERRYRVLAECAWLLIQQRRMKGIDKHDLAHQIEASIKEGTFNLYRFVDSLT